MDYEILKNSKKVFLDFFLEKVNHIDYGLIDLDNNFIRKLENDIDIWVDRSQINEFIIILEKCARENNWVLKKMNISPRINNPYEGKYALLLCENPFSVLQLDVWSEFHWRGFPLINCNFKEDIIPKENYKKLNDDSCILIGVLKDICYKNQLSSKVQKRLDRINFTTNSTTRLLKGYYNPRIINEISTLIHTKKYKKEDLKGLKTSLVYHSLTRRSYLQIRYTFRFLRKVVAFRFYKLDGIHIILLGPDGAGKSTVGNLLMGSELANDFYEKKVYGHTNFKIIPPLGKIFSLLKFRKKTEYVPRSTKVLPVHRAIIYPIYYLFDYLIGFLWLGKMKTNGGLFLLFDRYFDEFFVQKTFKTLSHKFLKTLIKLIPSPDLYFLITADPIEIFRRKQELTKVDIEEQIINYKKHLSSNKNAFIIQNNKDPLIAYQEIMLIISEHLKHN